MRRCKKNKQKWQGFNSAKRRWLKAISGMIVALVTAMIVMPGHATTIGASSVVLVGGQKTAITSTSGYPTGAVIMLNGEFNPRCDLRRHIKTSIHFSASGNEIGSIIGEGSIAMTGTGGAFIAKVNAVGNPPCGETTTVRVIYQRNNSTVGSVDIPIEFANSSCSVDVPPSITLPTIVMGQSLSPVTLTSNPVGNGTLTLIPSNTNGPVTAGKIVAADSTEGIVYFVSNASWKSEIAGWSGNLSTTKTLTFGSTNSVGLFSGTLTATISCN